MATYEDDIQDLILSRLTQAWKEQTPALLGQPEPALLLYEYTEWKGRPDVDKVKAYGREQLQFGESRKSAMTAEFGKSMYQSLGQLLVQVFALETNAGGAPLALRLANVVKVAFQGKRDHNVVYGVVTVSSHGRQGPWYQVNITVEFYWDEVR